MNNREIPPPSPFKKQKISNLYPNEDEANFVPVSQLAEIGEDFNEDDLLHLKVM